MTRGEMVSEIRAMLEGVAVEIDSAIEEITKRTPKSPAEAQEKEDTLAISHSVAAHLRGWRGP